MANARHGIRNTLLASLPGSEVIRIMPLAERVELRRRQVLVECGFPISFVYFIERGLVCSCSRPKNGRSMEVAMVGNMGLVGTALLLGADRWPFRAVVQVPGQALRLRAEQVRGLLESLPVFRSTVLRYVNALMVQQSQILVCNARHLAVQRTCRWLLMCLDRLGDDSIPLGHDVIARMLGVRRPTVTEVLNGLRDAGLIRYERMSLTVLERAGLEARACECHALIAAEYARMTCSGAAPTVSAVA